MWPIWVRVWQVSAALPLQADFVFTANLGGGPQQVIQPVYSDRHRVQHGLAVRYVQAIDGVVGSQCALLGHTQACRRYSSGVANALMFMDQQVWDDSKGSKVMMET